MPRHKLLLRRFAPQPPPSWRRLTSDTGFASLAQRRDWLLVLNARAIPFSLVRAGCREHLFVPPLHEQIARHEIEAYATENRPQPVFRPKPPLHSHWRLAPLYLIPPLLVYGFEQGSLPAPAFFPLPSLWQDAGCLNGIHVFIYGQWWRPAAALWLHAGLPHLAGNLFFGSIFLCLLARLCGNGYAWFLACLGGIAGNAASLLLHPLGYASVGFSTSVFAAIGAAAGIMLGCNAEKLLMPVAAAVALLAMLGTEGANTDYAAHICGLGCGLMAGIFYGAARRRGWPIPPAWLAGALAWLAPCGAWLLAFSRL